MRNTVATLLLLLLAAERNALRVIRADPEREATTERVAMPPMMARGFRLDLRVGGKWQTVYEDTENFLRLRKVSFAPVKADDVFFSFPSLLMKKQYAIFVKNLF